MLLCWSGAEDMSRAGAAEPEKRNKAGVEYVSGCTTNLPTHTHGLQLEPPQRKLRKFRKLGMEDTVRLQTQ